MTRPGRAQPWRTLSVPVGTALQLVALASAGGLARRAARRESSHRTALLIASWLLAYFSGHALAHWTVGRLGGIRFLAYGLHGTLNPAWYPPGLRWIMLRLPFLSARTDPSSLRRARPLARAGMYAAGPLATLGTSLGIPAYGRAAGIPGAGALLGFSAAWMAGMLIGELAPRSDLRRAWRAVRQRVE